MKLRLSTVLLLLCAGAPAAAELTHIKGGQVTGVRRDYPPDPASQYLAFGTMHDRGLAK